MLLTTWGRSRASVATAVRTAIGRSISMTLTIGFLHVEAAARGSTRPTVTVDGKRPQQRTMTTVVLVGNGLSVGFDSRLSGRLITERVKAAIDDDLRTLLDRVVHLGQPESPAQPIGADRGGFEQLAGPLDRLAEALIAVQDLLAVAGESEAVRGL